MVHSTFKIVALLTCIIFFFTSCKEVEAPKEIKEVLQKEGTNKAELVKLIEHYSKASSDSLKLKAAFFLIRNMDGWHYYQGELLDHYKDYLKLINRDRNHGVYFMSALSELYGPFSIHALDKKYDLEEMNADSLIANMDLAFKVWQEQPWGKQISFDQFCEYILPFRIEDESPVNNRHEIYTRYNPLLKHAESDPITACKVLNDQLRKEEWIYSSRIGFLPHFGSSYLLKYRVGTCREMTDLAVYVMRACGIPVAIDFVPQWPYRRTGHAWNVVFDKEGKAVMFMGADDSPGTPHKPGSKKGKVYRRNFSKNPQSLAMVKDKEDIVPFFLEDPRIKDVTDEYAACFDVNISFNKANTDKFAYLAVFSNTDWIPIHWAKLHTNKAVFTKMEGDIVYLPCFYSLKGVKAGSYPFVLDKQGKVNFLKPDTLNLIKEVNLNGIYPLDLDAFKTFAIPLGQFQGANRRDFKDAVDLHHMYDSSFPYWNEVAVNDEREFRYLRYKTFPYGYFDFGELEFYRARKKLTGEFFIPSGSENARQIGSLSDVNDNDMTTSFSLIGVYDVWLWLGVDLGKKSRVDKIRFTAGMDIPKTRIIPDHSYELFYWNDGWISLGRQTANEARLHFKNIPGNALYFLHDCTESQEERIFTLGNGQQVWW